MSAEYATGLEATRSGSILPVEPRDMAIRLRKIVRRVIDR